MATNKDFILSNKYLGFGTRGDTLVSPITPQWWYDPTSEPGVNLTFDLAAANALLEAAGYTNWTGGSPGNGVRMAARDLTFNNTNGEIVTVPKDTQLVFTMGVRQEFQQEQDTAVYLQQEWLSVGVQLNLKIELESALSADVYGGALETYIWYWSADPDPNYILSIESSFTLDGWNDNYWANATYDQLYVDQLAATGVAQRQQLVRDAQKLNYESAVYIIYLYQNGTWAYRTDRFTGWGDWKAHPYRQMDAFWGANPLFLELTPIGGATNTCPTTPVIQPAGPIAAFVNTTQSFTGNASDPDANQNLTWTWSWSDTTQTVHQSTTAVTEDSASHRWSSAGLYNISLAVFDGLCTKTSSFVEVNVTVGASGPSRVPFNIYLPKLDTAHPINLPLDANGFTTQQVLATTPTIPGLTVTIPQGTRIIGPDGNSVSQLIITPVPIDRSPMPFPPGKAAPILFAINPGGAVPSQPLPISFPNVTGAAPGTIADMYFFDLAIGGWNTWGTGTVSADGSQVVSDPGFGLPRLAGMARRLERSAAMPTAVMLTPRLSRTISTSLGSRATSRASAVETASVMRVSGFDQSLYICTLLPI